MNKAKHATWSIRGSGQRARERCYMSQHSGQRTAHIARSEQYWYAVQPNGAAIAIHSARAPRSYPYCTYIQSGWEPVYGTRGTGRRDGRPEAGAHRSPRARRRFRVQLTVFLLFTMTYTVLRGEAERKAGWHEGARYIYI